MSRPIADFESAFNNQFLGLNRPTTFLTYRTIKILQTPMETIYIYMILS